jgi:hypothetical protein
MTKKLQETLDLPDMEDVLSEIRNDPDNSAFSRIIDNLDEAEQASALIDGLDHAEGCDQIFEETLKHSQALMDLGHNVDLARAPRIFASAAEMYRIALSAKNSKRDAQLKRLKLACDQKLVELKENEVMGRTETIENDSVLTEDRNELIKNMMKRAEL